MTIFDTPIQRLSGEDATLDEHAGKALLIVNVASKCGLTPQYAGLEELHERLADRGFSVLGFPCNQFGGQEPGTSEEIAEFCSATYGVTFPMYEKVDVNGSDRHPIYQQLTARPGRQGRGRRHPVELREVPGRTVRRDRRPVPAADDARGPGTVGRDR